MGKDKEKGEPPMERIEERISGAKLTARDRKVLDYMMKNKETACFMAAAEIAELLEVSASCVVRLSGKLGFPTYYPVSYTHLDVYKRQGKAFGRK